MEIIAAVFAVLSLIYITVIYLEYRELKQYRENYPNLINAVNALIDKVNFIAEKQVQDAVLIREQSIDSILIKKVLDVHAKALTWNLPKKEWEELVEAVKKLDGE